ncbi:non-homologous end-joining DNA ligase [Legionella spiritensis]|uniref:non-homologous end-joining DNA ligase n=1 Tax=Legionella spiritensis TaxID=452 RepID=UPI000F6F9AB8|nr:non-homologous end-joining DNA ligase [Legionella spiritensis]VEG91111.1 Putative DNA ligase-like protein Rv0938/MT0965 [Legionella spiritensis]
MKNIDLTHPNKLLYPDDGIRKKDVADYYARIADYLLPFVKNRPLTMKRYPEGIHEEGFYNKHAPDYFPDFIPRYTVPMEKDASQMSMVGADSVQALVYLAGQNTLELHMALSTMDEIKKPDQMILDFDPSDDDFEKVRNAAFVCKEILDALDLPSFVKTTGSRGVHVHVPLLVACSFKEMKEIARKIAVKIHEKCPRYTTLEQRKNKRGDKVFIDYLRNDYAMTAIVPYSLRALPKAPVATPVDWNELADKSLQPQSYHLKNIFQRLGQKKDPWKLFTKKRIDTRSIRLE